MLRDNEFDIVVVGSGVAALCGAVAAASRGRSVCVIEKTAYFGGTSAYSGGSVWLPGNHVLERDGVDDSVAKGYTYFHSLVGSRTSEERQRAYLETGPALVDFLENTAGIPLEHRPFPDYFDAPGRSANGRTVFARAITAEEVGPRLNEIRPMVPADQFGIDVDRSVLDGGQAWVARLVMALDRSGNAELALNTTVEELVQDEAGRVVGVGVRATDDETGTRRVVHARLGVLVAAGGFERAAGLRQVWQQMPTADWSSSHPDTGSGDALRMLDSVGAELDLLDQSWWCPATLFPNGHAAFTLGLRAGVVVDDSGRRFANEMLPYDRMGHAMRARMAAGHSPQFWFVFDDRAGDQLPAICVPAPDAGEMREAGLWHTAPTIAELAAAIDVDAEALTNTVARFNAFAEAGHDQDFRRGEDPFGRFFVGATSAAQCLQPIEGTRFHAVRLVLGDLGTKGGAVVTPDGAVKRADGSTVSGLYAAGNSAASVAGAVYPGPGVPLGSGMVSAYRAVGDMVRHLTPA
ncbi:FAD-dependent oxidoreductase [Rhodococcus phenolicus]|uniref:FAD-dependent oxidoreductase n=1 Tax=Rhodococcus phenolicus TaxID=263849 RepID=UPI00082A54EC|nr:FAD-dependent oxidoreductase [Rhodococcus phenolicus]